MREREVGGEVLHNLTVQDLLLTSSHVPSRLLYVYMCALTQMFLNFILEYWDYIVP